MKIKGVEFLIGADPEFAVFDLDRELFVPACGLVPGDKLNPYALAVGDVQVDGTSVEIGIPPAKTKKQFVDSILKTKKLVQEMLPPNHHLVCVPAVKYTPEVLSETPPEAFISGCTPDYWLGEPRNPDTWGTTPKKTPHGFGYAYMGGHIHIGWTSGKSVEDPLHVIDCQVLVKILEEVLPKSVFNKGRSASGYGTPSSYRIKPYGVEYRAPSNWWCHNKETIEFMYDALKTALTEFMNIVQREDLIDRDDILSGRYELDVARCFIDTNKGYYAELVTTEEAGLEDTYSWAILKELLRRKSVTTIKGKPTPSTETISENISEQNYALGA